MFREDPEKDQKTRRIVNELGDHAITMSHSRHISVSAVQALGLKVSALEADQALQDALLSVHHSTIITLNSTPAIKIIENDRGVAFITRTCLAAKYLAF